MNDPKTTTQNPYGAAPNSYSVAARPKRQIPSAGRADRLFALLALILCAITVDFSCYGGFQLGFTISYLLWAVFGTVYLCTAGRRPTVFSTVSLLAAALLSVPFALYSSGFSKFLSLVAILVLSTVALLDASRSNRYSPNGFRFGVDILRGIWVTPFAHIGEMFRALFSGKRDGQNAKPVRKSAAILLGVLCALPLLLILIPLLMRADAAFEQIVRMLIGDPKRLLRSVILGAVLFLFVFSALMAYRFRTAKPLSPPRPANGRVDASGVNAFLALIGVVYLVYLFSQLSYLVGGFAGLLPEDYTYSAYAVRGFFEMCVVCVLNMGVVFGSILLSRRNQGKLPLSTALLELFICLFSLFSIATGVAKMILYIDRYGMTKLRLFTTIFMLALACCFVCVALRLFIRRFPYFKASLLAVVLIGLTVSFADVDATIARYNVWAFQNGRLEEMDVDTLARLSSSAIPEIARLLDDGDPYAFTQAANALANYAEEHGISLTDPPKTEPFDFRAYNAANEAAKEAILQNRDKILELLPPERRTPVSTESHDPV